MKTLLLYIAMGITFADTGVLNVAPIPTVLENNEKTEIRSEIGNLTLHGQEIKDEIAAFKLEGAAFNAHIARIKKAHHADKCELNPHLEWACKPEEKK